MKKTFKAVFCGFAVLTGFALFMMPRMVQSSIPSIYYITPNQKTYKNIINCTGTVQASQVHTVYLDTSIVARQVCVTVGDRVEAGEDLVLVDQERTGNIQYAGLGTLLQLSQNAVAEQPLPSAVDWEALAASYGLSVSVSGGAEQYGSQIKGLLSDAGIVSEAQGVFAAPAVGGSLESPIQGVVTDISIQPGVPMTAGSAVVTISDNSSYKVMAAVSESDIANVVVGDSVVVRGVGFGGNVYSGRVVKIYPSARKTFNGTATETVVDVEILLDYPNGKLKPGLTAKIEITGGEKYDLLTVPYEAIRQDENNDEYVYVYEGGKIQKTLVTTGKELTNEVQVLSGLANDSIVVYNPSDITKEGMMIHLKGRADVD